MKKKVLAMLLVLSMTASLAACGDSEEVQQSSPEESKAQTESSTPESSSEVVEESKWPEYLNMDSPYPIIKEDAEDIVLKMVIVQDSNANAWDDTWLSKYLSEKYNVTFEVESIPSTVLSERKNLLFNSGDLPDIMWNLALSTSELVSYGMEEGMLLACDEYISEELTPGLYHWLYEEREDARVGASTPDGHIYSLPQINEATDSGKPPRLFLNKAWLDELNIEKPKTLDEFTAAMYAIKEADPSGVGSENLYPLGGGMKSGRMGYYLLNALGYLTNDSYGLSPAVRNGEMVIPAYDIEVYQEYLKLMNQYYTDGIIDQNYFTVDSTAVTASMLEEKTATYSNAPYVSGIETWIDWEAVTPLTSEWNETAQWMSGTTYSIGNFVISAETEYPELCMRFADIFYNTVSDDPRAITEGDYNPEYELDFDLLYKYDPEQKKFVDNTELPDGLSAYNYKIERRLGLYLTFGVMNTDAAIHNWWEKSGYDIVETESDPTTNGDAYYRASVEEHLMPYITDTQFPSVYYLDQATSEELVDLKSVIDPYAQEQIALFITGARPLTEVDAFKDELAEMGMDRVMEIYQQVFDDYLANKG